MENTEDVWCLPSGGGSWQSPEGLSASAVTPYRSGYLCGRLSPATQRPSCLAQTPRSSAFPIKILTRGSLTTTLRLTNSDPERAHSTLRVLTSPNRGVDAHSTAISTVFGYRIGQCTLRRLSSLSRLVGCRYFEC